METRENVHFLDKVASALRKAAIELEEFQVQLSLGKATASDKFEELKKELNRFIDENKSKASETKDKIQTTLDELRVQLALGKAETLDAFREQKKKLLALIHEIETKIKNSETVNNAYAFTIIELEKFKAQLEVIEGKYQDGKETLKEAFEKGKKELNSFIDSFKNKISEKDDGKWQHFQDEIAEAFNHFKKAFSKPEQ